MKIIVVNHHNNIMETLESNHYQSLTEEFTFYLQVMGYSSSTINTRIRHIRDLFMYLTDNDIQTIYETTNQHIESFYHLQTTRENKVYGSGLKTTTINIYANTLKKFIEFLRDFKQLYHLTPELPYEERPEEHKAILTEEEIAELFAVTYQKIRFNKYPEFHGQRNRAMLAIYYSCGLRKSEGIALDISDIQQDRLLIRVRKGKGSKERYVPATYQTMQTITEYIHDTRKYQLRLMNVETESLLINELGYRCADLTLSLTLKRMAQRTANAELISKQPSLHTLRHSIATHLLASGMDIELIRQFLGHKSLDTTQIYTHLANE
jgi:integrase/recombinase XerD